MEFGFKKQWLFCANICEPLDRKHPDRWDRVVQCELKGIEDAPPLKSAVLKYCTDRSDLWSEEVAFRCHGVHDLAAAEAQYHVHNCYDAFRKIPSKTDNGPLLTLITPTCYKM